MTKSLFTSVILAITVTQASFTAQAQDRISATPKPTLTESQYANNNASASSAQNTGGTYTYSILPHMGTLSSTTNVQSVSEEVNLQIFPNPGSGAFTIKGSVGNMLSNEASIAVLDMAGRVVYRADAPVRAGNIDFQISLNNSLASGRYIVDLRAGGDVKRFNYIIQK